MADFQLRKIRKNPPRPLFTEKGKQNLLTALALLLLLLVLYWGGRWLIDRLSSTRVVSFVAGLIGKELEKDGQGRTNMLLLGVGGEGHEGKDLTDTIILASLNHAEKTVSMISIPRDMYIESSLGGSRINRLYENAKIKWDSEEGLNFVKQTLQDLAGIPIHYYAKVDFEALVKAVDSVGGIDLYVKQTINDPLYPKGETFEYELFFLPEGNQHLDGATTLKYVRSRKSSSDFDRSRRQQQVLLALKTKFAEENFLSRKGLIKQLYSSLQENVETNISLRELLSLAEFGALWDSKNLAMATLNDEPLYRGGFMYTPLRELYGGAYVLLPAGDNFDMVQKYVELLFYGPPGFAEIPLAVLNGTDINGVAATAKAGLHRFGVKTGNVGNARLQNIEETMWYVRPRIANSSKGASENSVQPNPNSLLLAQFLAQLIPGKISTEVPPEYSADPKMTETEIILEIGANGTEAVKKLDIFRNIVSLVPAGTSTKTTAVQE